MKTITVSTDVPLRKLVEQARREELVILQDGHPVAKITAIDDDDETYWNKRERSPEFIASIARARKQVAEGKTISHAELTRRIERRKA